MRCAPFATQVLGMSSFDSLTLALADWFDTQGYLSAFR